MMSSSRGRPAGHECPEPVDRSSSPGWALFIYKYLLSSPCCSLRTLDIWMVSNESELLLLLLPLLNKTTLEEKRLAWPTTSTEGISTRHVDLVIKKMKIKNWPTNQPTKSSESRLARACEINKKEEEREEGLLRLIYCFTISLWPRTINDTRERDGVMERLDSKVRMDAAFNKLIINATSL